MDPPAVQKQDMGTFYEPRGRIQLASNFFFLVGLKPSLNAEDEFDEVVQEILAGLSIEMIETVFGDWIDRFQRVIHRNGEHLV
jgi:hypothetical protein